MELNKKSKRKRVANFTADEKVLLTKLVNDRKLIVESKATDGKALPKKKSAWEAITLEFNSTLSVYKRDTTTLKRAWDNLKAITRKIKAVERGHLLRNGGGPSCPPQPAQQVAIMNLMEEASPALICKIENPYDSDAAAMTASNIFERAEPSKVDVAAEIICMPPDLPNAMELIVKKNPDEDGQQKLKSEAVLSETANIKQEALEDGHKNAENDSVIGEEPLNDVFQTPKRPSDFIRREADLRLKAVEEKTKKEMEILNQKLKTQEVQLETANIEQKRALMLLQAAQLEVEFQKRRLEQLLP